MRPSTRSIIALIVAGLTASCGDRQTVDPGEWPRFRGPRGDGLYEAASAPKRWGPNSRNILWKTPIPGQGNSSPIVSNGRVYLTTAYETPESDWDRNRFSSRLQRVVLALDLASGEELWRTTAFQDAVGAIHWDSTHAVSTPATDGERIFVAFDSRLAALDLDGRLVWLKNFDPDYIANSRYGASASVALTEKAVLLARDREDGERDNPGFLVAAEKETGDEIWRHEWTDTCCSYTTPLVVRRADKEEVLHSASSQLVAYDAETGTRLWSAEHPLIQPVPSLLLADGLLVSPGAIHAKAITVYRLSGDGADTRAEQLWQRRSQAPDIPSPILHGDKLFTVTKEGIMAAYQAQTGKQLWLARLPPGSYWGSPVATAERIYLPTMEGSTAVVSATSASFRLLAENELPAGSGASPALTSTCLLLRTESHLYCIAEETKKKKGGKRQPVESNDTES